MKKQLEQIADGLETSPSAEQCMNFSAQLRAIAGSLPDPGPVRPDPNDEPIPPVGGGGPG
jgi:hypothetical protein